MRTRKRLIPVVAGAVLALFVLAACGGGGGGGSETSNGGGGGQSGAIEVELGPGFVFVPAEITVAQGQTTTLLLKNSDSIPHNLNIEALGIDQDVAPGEEVEVAITPQEAGEFEFICDVPGHAEGGMVGTLIVQ